MAGTQSKIVKLFALIMVATLIVCSLNMPVLAANGSVRVTPRDSKTQFTVDGGILGIDVSKWNGTINWSRVAKENPISFAFVRSNYGTTVDPNFITNAKGAADNGLYVGAYHYATFKSRAQMQEEAQAFLNQLSKVSITYPVVLDLEHTTHGQSRANLTALAVEFMDIVAAQGYTVMLYTYENYVTKYLDRSKIGYGLWMANYLSQPTASHKIWQYTSNGKINGINGGVDINVAYSNMATRGGVQVSKDVSTTIRRMINERYGSDLSLESLDMDAVNHEMAKAFQEEVNRQLGGAYNVDGQLDRTVAESLATVPFTLNETNGRITCLIQGKLFYKGHYTESISGVYDDHTVSAIKAFQSACDLEATGEMNLNTWMALLGVAV